MLAPSTRTRQTKIIAQIFTALITSQLRKRKLQHMIFQFKRQKFTIEVDIDDNNNWSHFQTADFVRKRLPYSML